MTGLLIKEKIVMPIFIGMMLAAGAAQAASGTWLGTTDTYWDKDTNWSAAPRPYGNETATFNGPGNGKTTISLTKKDYAQTLAIRDVVFTGPTCAAYTLGPSGQTFWFMHNGTLTIDEDVVNDQKIGGTARFGNSPTSSTVIKLINNSPVAKLLLNGPNSFTTATKPNVYTAVRFEGVGDITFNNRLTTNGVNRFYLYNHNTGTITFAGAGESRINMLYTMSSSEAPGNTRVVLGSATELFIDYGSTDYSIWQEGDGVIEGAGTLRLGTGVGDNFARIYVKTGSMLTIRTPLTSEGGLEMRSTGSGGGTLVLDCINTMASNIVNSSIGSISVAKLGNQGATDSNLGSGSSVLFRGSGSSLIYTGAGETSDRLLDLTTSALLDHSGSGDLVLTEDLVLGTNYKTLTLKGSAAGAGEIAGVIGSNGTTLIAKEGTGLWRLAAANTYTGSTTLKDGTLALTGADGAITASSELRVEGGTLLLANNVDNNNVDRLGDTIPITLVGGTLNFDHDGGAAEYSETLGVLTVGDNDSTVSAAQADAGYSSTLTFDSLVRSGRGTINFTGTELGTDNRNRILFTTPPPLVNGYIGVWATVNGSTLAMYDETLGVIPAPASAYTNIAARGPDSVIPDDTNLNVRITTEGDSGPITLENESGSSVNTLTQMTDTPAVVATAGKTLTTYAVMVDQDADALTIGENAGDGMLKTSAGDNELLLANDSANTLTVNAAIADNAGATSLTKTGKGAALINGLVDITGNMLIQEGALYLADIPGETHYIGSYATLTGGAEAPAVLNLHGAAAVANNGNFKVSLVSGDRCVVNITSNLTVQAAEDGVDGKLYVGSGFGTAGAMIQSAGSVVVSSGLSGAAFLVIGNSSGYGYYRMTGGMLTSGEFTVGGSGSIGGNGNVAVFDLYDGQVTADKWCMLLAWGRGVGVANLFGGSYGGGATVGGEVIFSYGVGSSVSMLNMLGPTARLFDRGVANQKILNMARGAGNIATVCNLNDGELTLYKAYATTNATPSLFNFNGGVLKAADNSPLLMEGLTAATVYPGGAKIDTDGFAATLNQPLLAPDGYGATEIALTSGGADYIGAPAVLITGGTGIGATAIAIVDLKAASPTCGQVTNVMITCAGSGYGGSDTLTAALLGGGCLTPATLGAVTLGVNVSGGLTKLGDGTLTLGGASTYSGGTTVSGGTLTLGVADALLPGSDVTLDNGTLDLNGLTVSNTVFGTGLVVNGTLYASFSPGGTNVIASQSAAASTAALAGTYLVDVTDEGACDTLTFQGDVDLSNVALQIVDPEQLNRRKVYTIANATGTLSGVFDTTNLADDRWRVYAGADKVVRLFFSDGLLLILR